MNSEQASRPAQPGPTAAAPTTWSGRFSEPVDERVKRFTASVAFDQRLALFDIEGSLAHARMLAGANVAGGVILWVAIAARWNDFEPGARWVLAAMGDSFILIGALEAFALWRTREMPAGD